MQLFYNSELNPDSKSLILDKEESRHIIKVLRKKEGDLLSITDGKGRLYLTRILNADVKKCALEVLECTNKKRPREYHLHLAIAPTKMNDRFEWFLEKSTEIGVDEITPLLSEHSERRTIKTERMEKILASAMKQSLQFNLPVLHPMSSFEELLQKDDYDLKLIAHCADGKKISIRDLGKEHRRILVLIGPEGDFSRSEIERARSSGFTALDLGKSRLRTETAGIVACSQIAMVKEFL